MRKKILVEISDTEKVEKVRGHKFLVLDLKDYDEPAEISATIACVDQGIYSLRQNYKRFQKLLPTLVKKWRKQRWLSVCLSFSCFLIAR